MSFAYLPLYTGDYQRDTLHLSMLEHGAYLKLLMYCWDQQGPAPDDDRKLAGICNARSKEEVTAVRAILEEFFVLMDGGWYNKRLEAELHKAEIASDQARIRGRMSAEARRQKYGTAQPRNALETLSIVSRKAPESLPNPPTPSPSPIEKPPLPPKGGDVKFAEFWSSYPKKVGKGAAEKAWATAKVNGHHAEVMASLEKQKKSEQWQRDGGQFIPNPATWINQRRWEDELPPAGAEVKPRQAEPAWWATEQGILRKGQELGLAPRGGESWHEFKGRVQERIGRQENA
jgi:uncharacterized protein YdaU (DUF1376 family)